tara:strand:+ start:182 stop:592 length:411 start_codon:yes stop_codon:yes gene_type:complete
MYLYKTVPKLEFTLLLNTTWLTKQSTINWIPVSLILIESLKFEIMKISSITTTRKAKQFSFTPRYYNQQKEEFDARRADIEARITGKRSDSGIALTGLKDKWKRNKNTTNFEKKSNIRLAFIVSILFGLCYWVLFS